MACGTVAVRIAVRIAVWLSAAGAATLELSRRGDLHEAEAELFRTALEAKSSGNEAAMQNDMDRAFAQWGAALEVLEGGLGHLSASLAEPRLAELRAVVAANLCIRTSAADQREAKEARCGRAAAFLREVWSPEQLGGLDVADAAPAGFMLLKQAKKVAFHQDALGVGAAPLVRAIAAGAHVATRLCLALGQYSQQIDCGRHVLSMLYREFSATASAEGMGSANATAQVRRAVAAVHALPALSLAEERAAAKTFRSEAGVKECSTCSMHFEDWVCHVRALPQGRLASPDAFKALGLDSAQDSWALGPPVGGFEVEYISLLFEPHFEGVNKDDKDLQWHSKVRSAFNPANAALAVTLEHPVNVNPETGKLEEGVSAFVEIISGPVPITDLYGAPVDSIRDVANALRASVERSALFECEALGPQLSAECAAVTARTGDFSQPAKAWAWCLARSAQSFMDPRFEGPMVQVTEEWNLAEFPQGRWAEPWVLAPELPEKFAMLMKQVAARAGAEMPLAAFAKASGQAPSVAGHAVEGVFRAAAALAAALPPSALLQGWAALALWGQLHDALWRFQRLGQDNGPTYYKNLFVFMPNADLEKLWRHVAEVRGPVACDGTAVLAAFPRLGDDAPAAHAVFKQFLGEVCQPGGPSKNYLAAVSLPFRVRRNRVFVPRCAAEVCYVAVEARSYDARSWEVRRALRAVA